MSHGKHHAWFMKDIEAESREEQINRQETFKKHDFKKNHMHSATQHYSIIFYKISVTGLWPS